MDRVMATDPDTAACTETAVDLYTGKGPDKYLILPRPLDRATTEQL
jgi:hypothetical protein